MTLQHWITVWKVLVIGGISSFAVLAIVVSIGGFMDVRRLFRTLKAQHAVQDGPSKSTSPNRH